MQELEEADNTTTDFEANDLGSVETGAADRDTTYHEEEGGEKEDTQHTSETPAAHPNNGDGEPKSPANNGKDDRDNALDAPQANKKKDSNAEKKKKKTTAEKPDNTKSTNGKKTTSKSKSEKEKPEIKKDSASCA